MRLITRICLFALAACACGTRLAAGPYRFETLEVSGGRVVRADDINNEGHILGGLVFGDESHNFVFDGTSYTIVDCLDDLGA